MSGLVTQEEPTVVGFFIAAAIPKSGFLVNLMLTYATWERVGVEILLQFGELSGLPAVGGANPVHVNLAHFGLELRPGHVLAFELVHQFHQTLPAKPK